MESFEGTKSIFYKDSAIIRFVDPNMIDQMDLNFMNNFEKDKETNEIIYHQPETGHILNSKKVSNKVVQVVNDTGLYKVFEKRANDVYWNTISCIQTNIKA